MDNYKIIIMKVPSDSRFFHSILLFSFKSTRFFNHHIFVTLIITCFRNFGLLGFSMDGCVCVVCVSCCVVCARAHVCTLDHLPAGPFTAWRTKRSYSR